MGSSYQINIVRALFLKRKKNFSQRWGLQFFSFLSAAFGVFLKKAEFYVTPVKENGSAAFGTADTGLFPEVQGSSGRFHGGETAAVANTMVSVNFAVSGAEPTVGSGKKRMFKYLFHKIDVHLS